MKRALTVAGLLLVLVIGGGDDEGENCLPVSKQVKKGFAEGGGGRLGKAAAVRSAEFKKVWFISAEIIGPAIEPGDAVGTWAVNFNPSSPPEYFPGARVLWANEVAADFRDVAKEDSEANDLQENLMSARAVEESQDCL